MNNRLRTAPGPDDPSVTLMGEEVVEIQLLLPGWQASVLETVAHQRGMTAAIMLRHLLRDFLSRVPTGSGTS